MDARTTCMLEGWAPAQPVGRPLDGLGVLS